MSNILKKCPIMRSNLLKKYRSFLVVLMFFSCSQKREIEENFIDSFEILVLKNGKLNQNIEIKLDEQSIKTLTYNYVFIGRLKSKREDYLLLYKTTLAGYNSPQLNNYLIIYNDKYDKIGYFYMQGIKTPVLEGNSLTFSNMDNNCKQTQKIDFTDNFPIEIFIPCNNDQGDIINFIKVNQKK